jgi:hypothetical protein
MSVSDVLAMPYEEFLGWFKFFKIRPVGWQEDYRTSLLLNAQGVKKKASEIFPSLKALEGGSKSKGIDPNFMRMLQGAVGGDKNWKPILE